MALYSRLITGKQSEQSARLHLEKNGLRFIAANYRSPFGEIDLIMQDQQDIVFVEVRSKTRTDYGTAIETINSRKKYKLIRTAKHFLIKHNWLYTKHSRFDVVGIHYLADETQIKWIKNAFLADAL